MRKRSVRKARPRSSGYNCAAHDETDAGIAMMTPDQASAARRLQPPRPHRGDLGDLPLDASGHIVAGRHPRADTPRARAPARRRDTRRRVDRASAAVQVYLRDAADFAAMNETARRSFAWIRRPHHGGGASADPAALVAIAATVIPDDQPRGAIHPAAWKRSPKPYATRSAAATRCGWPPSSRGAGRMAAPSMATSASRRGWCSTTPATCSPRPGSPLPMSSRRASSSAPQPTSGR